MTKDEVVSYAQDCAAVFLRENRIDEQEHADYMQEAAAVALGRAHGKQVMDAAGRVTYAVNKHFISESVKNELRKMWRREANEGFGSHHVASPQHVSLSETVAGAFDDEGEPLTYGDTLVYEDPPDWYGDPSDEIERSGDMDRLRRALKALSAEDQSFADVALLSGRTQAQAAAALGVTQQAVQRRTGTIVKKLQSILL